MHSLSAFISEAGNRWLLPPTHSPSLGTPDVCSHSALSHTLSGAYRSWRESCHSTSRPYHSDVIHVVCCDAAATVVVAFLLVHHSAHHHRTRHALIAYRRYAHISTTRLGTCRRCLPRHQYVSVTCLVNVVSPAIRVFVIILFIARCIARCIAFLARTVRGDRTTLPP